MKKILLMLSLLFFTTAGFSEVSDTLVTGGYDKQAMSDAIKHARKEIDKFIEVMNKKDADTFAVKAPITDHGRTEHFWLTDVTYSNGMFIGVISNDPGYCYKRRIWPSGKSRKKIFQTGCIRAGIKFTAVIPLILYWSPIQKKKPTS